MRRYPIVLFWFLFAVPLLTQAQSDYAPGHFGIKAGPALTRTSVSGITPNIPKNKIDYQFGAMYQLRLNRFVLQPEVLYAVKGGTFQVIRLGSTNRETTRNNYNYVSVPLLIGWIPTPGIILQAGPEFSYALNTPRTNGPGSRNDLGIVVGAHYDFLDMLEKFSLQVRYIHGLNDVSGNPLATFRNQALQASIVYNFYRMKKK
ncbi:hypothetical protein GCM10023189_07590 [Nibrella saemangeumensis]|uniref:Outer membrane protein beta-barrel domain-containing protein n=1 Tax=Nibrella saemangeumensis TaxID=1084526 RepID=A0ABP8MEB9_9BACT